MRKQLRQIWMYGTKDINKIIYQSQEEIVNVECK